MGTEKKVLIKRKHNRIAKMREHAVMEGINWTLEGNIKVHKNKKKTRKRIGKAIGRKRKIKREVNIVNMTKLFCFA